MLVHVQKDLEGVFEGEAQTILENEKWASNGVVFYRRFSKAAEWLMEEFY